MKKDQIKLEELLKLDLKQFAAESECVRNEWADCPELAYRTKTEKGELENPIKNFVRYRAL